MTTMTLEQKVARLKLVADGLRRIQEFESARYLDEYASHLAQPAQAVDYTGRSAKDYAIEHAGYMARGATGLIDAINDLELARQQFDEGGGSEDATNAAEQSLGDAMGTLRNLIYEFEKRRDRALSGEKAPAPIAAALRPALLWLLWHHQGGSSLVGQPLRALLGMGQHERMTPEQVEEASNYRGAGFVRTTRLLTYTDQPDNQGAWRLGEACMKAKPGGDLIDRGLSLLQELGRLGYGVVEIGKEPDADTGILAGTNRTTSGGIGQP